MKLSAWNQFRCYTICLNSHKKQGTDSTISEGSNRPYLCSTIVSIDVRHDAGGQLFGHSEQYLSLILFVLFQSKMMVILQGESEGIVRREAAALIKEIYDHHKFLWVLVLSI